MNELSTKGDQARREILMAARRLFVRNGFHGTSMRAIAREAGGSRRV
ncbi:MAG: TetR/AcrR family transcriptional regulator [Anaerolineae bacterium]|nr:TetR/AcrR family transcriptional regulator [Anaerolineae bacterium]